ncbi:MAG: flippase-like domain-containing protein, partial [Candidatus Kapabacteria bacterium]|nr:flippase-like domain-containing protein [Candidatus Kapabacteria bacterium]
MNQETTSLTNYFIQLIRRYGFHLLKIFVGIGLILFLIQKISLKEIFISLTSINLFYFSLVVLLSLVNIFLQFLRWKVLMLNETPSVETNRILKSLLIGFSAGTFTPARSGEYFLRKLPLSQISLTSTITLTFIDKMMLLVNVIFWGALVSFG